MWETVILSLYLIWIRTGIDYNIDYIALRCRCTRLDEPTRIIPTSTAGLEILEQGWTPRCGLQNRRLRVRFLSHLSLIKAELKRLPAVELEAAFPSLTPFDSSF
jgi:hypothetical protein